MSKIKQLLTDVYIVPTDNGCVDEAQAQDELRKWMDTDEAKLISFTTEQLNDEIFRRAFAPLHTSLKRLNNILDSIDAGNAKPF